MPRFTQRIEKNTWIFFERGLHLSFIPVATSILDSRVFRFFNNFEIFNLIFTSTLFAYKTPDERTIQFSLKGIVFAIQCSKPREDVNGFNEAFKTLLSLNNSNGSISYVWHFYISRFRLHICQRRTANLNGLRMRKYRLGQKSWTATHLVPNPFGPRTSGPPLSVPMDK